MLKFYAIRFVLREFTFSSEYLYEINGMELKVFFIKKRFMLKNFSEIVAKWKKVAVKMV